MNEFSPQRSENERVKLLDLVLLGIEPWFIQVV